MGALSVLVGGDKGTRLPGSAGQTGPGAFEWRTAEDGDNNRSSKAVRRLLDRRTLSLPGLGNAHQTCEDDKAVGAAAIEVGPDCGARLHHGHLPGRQNHSLRRKSLLGMRGQKS